jgi:hypothetical protein
VPSDLGFVKRGELMALMATFPELHIRVAQFRQVGKTRAFCHYASLILVCMENPYNV